ncbi:MAG: tyrosine-type recombinase/integrase [Nitrospira sp.]|nr:tyrosine-type recombinase/integrase [Nitrospira sp.]
MALAISMANTIVANIAAGKQDDVRGSSPTLRSVADEHYFPSLRRSGCVDMPRMKSIVKRLCEAFPGPIESIKLAGVNAYIDSRRKQKAANGTIRKEVGVLRRILSLAEAHDIVRNNACDHAELPPEVRRQRVASDEELAILLDRASTDMGRMITLAITIGLRQGKLLEIETSWLRRVRDGQRWLHPEAGSSVKKGTPEKTPLNNLAWRAITSGVQVVHGRIFRRWATERSFKRAWERLLARCRKDHPGLFKNLRFHDLRHTFTTILKGLEVSYEVRQALLGHSMKGSTGGYSHGSPGFDRQLVEAVTLLNSYLVSALNNAGASAQNAVND